MITVHFYTLGCRVNQYETDAVRELFLDKGFSIIDDCTKADVCVINTCTVTGEADRKSRQQLRRAARINPNAIICAMGCASEMSSGSFDADIICGTKDKASLPDKVLEFIKLKKEITHTTSHTRPEVTKKDSYRDFGTVLSPEGTRAFVKIEDGCNNFCSYCIIPFARGRVCSRSLQNTMDEVNFLAKSGFKEIVFTGIHLCSYGKDRGEDIMSLLELLKQTNAVQGIKRIRLGSLEPMSLTEDFLQGLASIDKLCPHFHLSLQSGSDTVLKRMNRKYTSVQYRQRVELLRQIFPHMSLTTDVICGFPGESEEEFLQTKSFVEELRFSKLHVFPYSVREGTVAAGMKQLKTGISNARTAVLNSFSKKAEETFATSFVGQEVEVLLEALHEDSRGAYISGYTREYVHAQIRSVDGVKVTSDSFAGLKGQIVVGKPENSGENYLIMQNAQTNKFE